MCDFPVVAATEMTKQLAELFLLLDEKNFRKGIIISSNDDITQKIKDLSVSHFDVIENDEKLLREKISSFKKEYIENPVIVTIDNYFSVKGVGTVVLGLVKSGSVKQYDELVVYPIGKKVTVKSMQSQDKDIKVSEPFQRIGFALKGVEIEELKRGYIMSNSVVQCSKKLKIDFTKNKYSKFVAAAGKKIMVNLGLQVMQGEITRSIVDTSISSSLEPMEIVLDNAIAAYEERCLLLSPDTMPRIIGSGKIINFP
jgi:selenocysteine-specific translation elongation factor